MKTFSRRWWEISLAMEKFFKSLFLKVDEEIEHSMTTTNTGREKEQLYFSKFVVIKRGPIKVKINSEHRGGEMYKNFVTVYLFGIIVAETFWRTDKGNDSSFHTTGNS